MLIKDTAMLSANHVAKDISYASAARGKSGRAVIRALENATGRYGMIRRAEGYEQDICAGNDIWRVMLQRYGLSLNVVGGSLENIPTQGPLVLMANHPFGILDGLIMGHILSGLRGDFRILAHRIFRQARDLDRVVLPISFDNNKAAMQLNLNSRKAAMKHLGEDGAIGIFPGGTVSTAIRPFAAPMDPVWRNFTAKMIAKSGATVVPMFFEGNNSRLFQIASHLHNNLRVGLLIKEFRKRTDTPVRMVIGEPISAEQIFQRAANPKNLMDFLREETYALSPRPVRSLGYGYDI